MHSLPDDEVYKTGAHLSHTEAMCLLQQQLANIIQDDVLLNNLPPEVTLEEVNSQIALEYGQAITVHLKRADHDTLDVVVIQNGTVQDLQKAIQRHMTLKLSRDGGPGHISWDYVWKAYWLVSEGQKLTDKTKLLKEYGIKNHSEISFIKRLKEK